MGKVDLGSYDERNFTVSGSVPLSDNFAIGGAITKQDHKGYGKNLTTGAEHYNKDVLSYRLSAEFKPTDDLSVKIAYDKYQDDSNPRHGHREATAPAAIPAFSTPAIGMPPANKYDTYAGLGDNNSIENEGLSATIDLKLTDQWSLKSITASRRGATEGVIDFDNTPAKFLDVPARYADNQETQEIQLQYAGSRWSTVLGFFYMNATASGAFDTQINFGGATVATSGKVRTQSIAYFFDSSFKANDQLSFSFGGRFNQDKKRASVFRATYLGAPSPLFGGTQPAPFLLRSDYTGSKTFTKFTPRVSASYAFSPDVTGYASISEGFKSGGYDMRGDAILIPQVVSGYNPENRHDE